MNTLTVEQANEIMAMECGVEFKIYGGSTYWKMPSTKDWRDAIPDWTILDPRCREIVRNWWLSRDMNLRVIFTEDFVAYVSDEEFMSRDNELACILQIAEQLEKQ